MSGSGLTDYSRLTTSELIALLCAYYVEVPLELAEEIVARGSEVVPALSILVSRPEAWTSPGTSASIHAMHLLGAIGDPAAVPALLAPMSWNEPSDFITENMAGVFAHIGPSAIPKVREFLDDAAQDNLMRSVAYDGLVGIALLHPECAEQVRLIGRELALRCLAEQKPFSALIGTDLAAFQNEDDLRLLDQLCHSELWEDETWADWEDVLRDFKAGRDCRDVEQLTRDPMEYFSPEEQARLKQIWLPVAAEEDEEFEDWSEWPSVAQPKVGRNAPCPCGSGRKYKRCCGRFAS